VTASASVASASSEQRWRLRCQRAAAASGDGGVCERSSGPAVASVVASACGEWWWVLLLVVVVPAGCMCRVDRHVLHVQLSVLAALPFSLPAASVHVNPAKPCSKPCVRAAWPLARTTTTGLPLHAARCRAAHLQPCRRPALRPPAGAGSAPVPPAPRVIQPPRPITRQRWSTLHVTASRQFCTEGLPGSPRQMNLPNKKRTPI
jgi:hypothetical protein